MNKRHYEHTLPNIRGSLSNTYICPITRYFTAFLIPVTLQPKGIGQANQAPAAGSVPISANSNPSVGGFLFALANSKVCPELLEILSAALNALPGRSRDRVTPKS